MEEKSLGVTIRIRARSTQTEERRHVRETLTGYADTRAKKAGWGKGGKDEWVEREMIKSGGKTSHKALSHTCLLLVDD